MANIGFIFKRIVSLDYKSLFDTTNKVHKLNHKNRLSIFMDIIKCGLKYEAGYIDYLVFRMDLLNDYQRSTYITRGKNNSFVRTLNDKDYWYILSDKGTFLKTFKDFINRDYLDLEKASIDDLKDFIDKHPKFIAKPKDGTHGYKVEKIDSKDKDVKDLKEELLNNGQKLVEEIINQHPSINEIYPYSVNSLRIVTIKNDDKIHYVFACMRIGNDYNTVDNLNHGGMAVIIDIDKACLKDVGCDRLNREFYRHPITNTEFNGFKIPYFNEALKMIEEASKLIPHLNYVGWDVAISDKGPLLIEANEFPGHDIYQLPCHMRPDYIGLYPRFKKALDK